MAVRKPTSTYNFQSPSPLPASAPVDAVKVEFARRLQHAMNRKGWDQAELARRAGASAGRDSKLKLGRDSVSKYTRGLNLPGPAALSAIAKALGVKPEDLLPTRGVASAGDANPPLDIRVIEGGMVWLKVNQSVPYDIAMQIMKLLKTEGA